MANETLGASFSIDITELKAGLAQANRLIRESESEFRAAAAGMDDWTESQEGLEARQKSLNKQIDLQKEKVSALTKEKARIIAEMEKEGKSAEEIARATDAVNKSITQESKQLDKLKGELSKTEKALDDFGKETEDAEKKTKDAGDGTEKLGSALDGLKASAGVAVGAIAAVGAACVAAVGSFLGLAESTRESRNEMAKLKTSFQTAKLSADNATKTFTELYGIMGDEGAAVEAAQQLAKISKDEKDLAANTRILTGVMAEYGNSIPLEGLAEGIAASASMSSVQGVLADALEWQGVNLDDFNEKLAALSTEEERSALIQQTLTGLYGESADAYRENNAAIIASNEAQARMNESLNKFGAMAEPIMTKVKEGFAAVLEKVLELVEGVDMEAFGAAIENAFATFIDEIIPAIVDGLQWIVDNKDFIIAGIVGIGAAFAAFKVVSLIQGVVSALKTMTIAQYALNLAMSLNPIGLVVAAVAGLVAAFVVLWNKCDAFRQFWIDLWEGIKKAFGVVVNWVKENWDTMLLALVNPLGAIFKYCYEHFEGFRNFVDNIVASVKKFFSDMWTGFTTGAANAWQAVKDTFSKVGTFFKDTFTKAWTAVKNIFSAGGKIFDGIKEGIANAFKNIVNAIIRGINKVVAVPFNAINKVLDKIRNVSIAGINPFSKLISKIAVPQIPQLATGGIVIGDTLARIGERGKKEAVLPLEQNTQWMDMLADKIAAKNAVQPQQVVVNQNNTYSQEHSRYEIWQSQENTAAAVKLALMGG